MDYMESPAISVTTDDASMSVARKPPSSVSPRGATSDASDRMTGYNSLGLKDDIEAMVPQVPDMSVQCEMSTRQLSEYISSSSDDNSDMFGHKFL